MRIVSASVYTIEWPFFMPVEHSLARNLSTRNVVVGLESETGVVGYGEGIPRLYVTGEKMDESVGALKEDFLPKVVAREFLPEACLSYLAETWTEDLIDRYPAAACAVELALVDLAGRILGRPAYDLLGGAVRSSLTYSAVVPITDPDKARYLLGMVRKLEMREVKLKAGFEGDVELASMARSMLDDSFDIRIDANAAWTVEEALSKIRRFDEYRISSVEQPLPAGDWTGHARLRREVRPKILMDESICTLSDARRLIEARAADGFLVKLSKCGGYSRTLRLVDLARRHGLACVLSCQVGELGLLSAAGRHLGVTQPDWLHLEGSLTRYFLARDLIAEDLTPGPGGRTGLPAGPGLGVTIDRQLLSGHEAFRIS